jgi:hypothetical protein
MRRSSPAVDIEVDHCGPEDCDAVHVLELPLETVGIGDVVGVESRDVAAASLVEAAVQRGRKAQSLIVPQNPQPFVVNLVEDLGRRVRGPVVDDQELDFGHALVERARDCSSQIALTVRDGEEDRHERGGLHRRPVA